MKRRTFLPWVCAPILGLLLTAHLVGQGVNYRVNISSGIYYAQPFSVQAWSNASAGAFPLVWIEGYLSGAGGPDYQTDQGWGYAEIDLFSWYVAGSSYVLTVFACADWYDGYYDCNSDYKQVTTPPATPVLSSIDPTSGTAGECYAFNAYGENLEVGSINADHWGLSITNQSPAHNQISATLCIDPATPQNSYSITVSTSAGTTGPKTFYVN